jgi:hypothetical protein
MRVMAVSETATRSAIDRLDRASAPALHRLRDYRVMGWERDTVDDVIDYCIARHNHRKGLGPRTARELLQLGNGEFCLLLSGDSTDLYVRWIDGEDFLVKTVWRDAWPDCRSDGEVEWEVKSRDSVGHHLDHAICAYQDKTVLLTENHFDESPPEEVV